MTTRAKRSEIQGQPQLSAAPKQESSAEKTKRLAALHQKKRRLQMLDARLLALQADHDAGRVRIAFGSKKLFRAQFDLEANGFASHDAWRDEWRASRSSQFMVLGSKDETAGCQGCVATSRRWPSSAASTQT